MSAIDQRNSPVNWLFVKGTASLRVEEAIDTALVIHGPGAERRVHRFRDAAERTRFQGDLERRLAADGWHFEGHAIDRRSAIDRRRMARAEMRDRRTRTG